MAGPQIIHSRNIEPIRCPRCNLAARITRRSPDAFRRDGTEIWMFQCDNSHITEVKGQG